MKTISVVIPCYNEEKSIREMYHRLKKIFVEELTQYDYEIIYVDDFSKDNTRVEIEKLCTEDEKVKAVLSAYLSELSACVWQFTFLSGRFFSGILIRLVRRPLWWESFSWERFSCFLSVF